MTPLINGIAMKSTQMTPRAGLASGTVERATVQKGSTGKVLTN